MSLSDQILRLACKICWWVPEYDLTMNKVEAHYKFEHPTEFDNGGVELELAAFCPRDGLHMELGSTHILNSGLLRHNYTCEKCKRSYHVNQSTTPVDPNSLLED